MLKEARVSKYRVQIDISFDVEQDAIDLMNYVEKVKSKVYIPKMTEKIECYRMCRYHECSHDDIKPVPCSNYIDIDFDKPESIIKIK